MGVDSASRGVLTPILNSLGYEAAQLRASLWGQKRTEGGGSCRVEPVAYDDAGGNIMGPERQHYGLRHNMELRLEIRPSSMRRGPGSAR